MVGAASAPDHVPRGARGVDSHEPLAVVEARGESAIPTAVPLRVPSVSTAAARTLGSESHVSSMSVASPSSGYGRSSVAPQNRTRGSSRGAA